MRDSEPSLRDRSAFHPTRRDLLALGVGALVAASIPFARSRDARRLVRRRLPMMGTIAEIDVLADGSHAGELRAHVAIDAAFARLGLVERTMTRHVRTSEIGRANEEAARREVDVSGDTATVLATALRWAERSGGAFDPCLGAAVLAWDVEHRNAPIPDEEARAFASRRLWSALDLRPTAGGACVRFADPAARLDLGGIAKGYAVDRAVDVLRAHGVSRALVNVGGDLYALGDAGDGSPWSVGVQSPTSPDGILARLDVADGAVATSGDYVRGFTYGGRRYHHLIDPATGSPYARRHSLTVSAEDCITADAGATAVYGMDREVAARTLAAVSRSARIEHEI